MIRAREDRWFDRFRSTGDPRLLAKVFDHTAPELARVAAHVCRDRHAAEDAVQSTFLAAIEAKHEWDAARPLLPWLLGLLVNRARQLRRQQRLPEATRVVLPAGERDPADLADAGEVDCVLRDALVRIPEPYRDTLERHLVHGLAAHEIADAIGVPAGTVRMRLHRGLDQLRQRLPQGLVAGAVAAVPTTAFAAMRREILATVPGGLEVGKASLGHFAVGWLGVILMNKTLMTVLVASLALVTSRWFLPDGLDAAALPNPAPASLASASTGDAPVAEPAAAGADDDARQALELPPPPATSGTLHVVLTRSDSGEPLSDHPLQVYAGQPIDRAQSVANAKPIRARTDAAGEATLLLPPGLALVTYDLDPKVEPWRAEITAGKTVDLIVSLPLQIDTKVEVVDDEGRAVAGARIFASTQSDMSFTDHEVGHTGADGCWLARFVDRHVPLRAEHDGFTSSRVIELSGGTAKVRLVLSKQPATLSGTVYDRDGKPMAEALVFLQSLRPGYRGERPIPIRADAAGRYVCRHVPPGRFILATVPFVTDMVNTLTQAEGTVEAGQALEIDLRFGTGPTLIATLTDADGKPLAGKSVRAHLQPDDDLWSTLTVFGYLTKTTDEQGVAEFQGLIPGSWSVGAADAASDRFVRVQMRAGEDQRVALSLVAKTWVEARIVDADDRPLVGWQVKLCPAAGGQVTTAETDVGGLVRFADLADQLYEIDVHAPKASLPSVQRRVANAARTTVRIQDSALPTAIVHGAVRLMDGMRPDEIRVAILLKGKPTRIQLSLTDDHTFRSDGLPAGSYIVVVVRARDDAVLQTPIEIVLVAGATHDLGTLSIQPSLSMRTEVAPPVGGTLRGLFVAGALPAQPRAFVRAPQSLDGNTVTMPGLIPGNYELLVWGENIAPTLQSVTLSEGGEPFKVATRPGFPVAFVLQSDLKVTLAQITIFRDGQEILSLHTQTDDLTLGFEPGSYRIEVDAFGWRGGSDFVVTKTPQAEPVTIRLTK